MYLMKKAKIIKVIRMLKRSRYNRYLYLLIYSITLSALHVACTNDNEEDLFGEMECGTEVVSFQQDIQPIINTNCAIPGCHVSGSQFPDFSEKENIMDNAGEIRTRTRNRVMPPPSSGKSLTDEQIQLISCWVNSGAQDN